MKGEVRRVDVWIATLAIAAALLVHALVPRYQFQHMVGYSGRSFVRIDRWTGVAQSGVVEPGGGWVKGARPRPAFSSSPAPQVDPLDKEIDEFLSKLPPKKP